MLQLLFPRPLLTTTSAHLISLAFACAYVGSIYLSKNARLSFSKRAPRISNMNDEGSLQERNRLRNERWRDDPDVIRARLLAVSVATLLCCTGVFGVLWWQVGAETRYLDIAIEATFLRLGLFFFVQLPQSLQSLIANPLPNILPHLVAPVLFLGPLYGSFLGGELPGQRNWFWRTHVVARFCSIQGIRNYTVAPLTEELVFRGCVLAVYHLSGTGKGKMVFLTPLTFGLAHVHHAWDTYNRYGRTGPAAKRAIISSLFQLAYTSLFGFHVAYIFLRTGSLLPSISGHVFCNLMGLPEIAYELRRYPKRRKVIITMYLLGIAGYIYVLPRWTQTEANFYWPREGDEAYVYGKY
ncbi:unnamed protein product [Cyclocybe aegerita]|uniref:intramembrane prenyl-peptidase Rce1 n=1 Tax=Cyclocybe aegerita TaxID=1973307 RepID=A0A8S0XMB0_CYCAE|nr:unnamed protein product [Cyclocybe aegerita]